MTHFPSISVIFFLFSTQQSCQAKVSDLHMVRSLHQHIPGRQIAMNQATFFQIVHSLLRKVNMFLNGPDAIGSFVEGFALSEWLFCSFQEET